MNNNVINHTFMSNFNVAFEAEMSKYPECLKTHPATMQSIAKRAAINATTLTAAEIQAEAIIEAGHLIKR
jgi:hypothetical protein